MRLFRQWVSILIITGLWAISVSAAAKQSVTKPLNSIVAIVGQNVITHTELMKEIMTVTANLKARGTPLPPALILREKVLDQLVDQQVQLQIAKKSDVTVSNAELSHAIKIITERDHKTTAAFKKKLAASGLTYSAFKQEVRRQLIIQKLQSSAIGPKIHVSPAEVKQLVKQLKAQAGMNEEYHVANILVPLPEEPSSMQISQAKTAAEKLAAQLKQGANFQQLAVSHSTGQNALKGGDMGWHRLAGLPSLFAKAIESMKTGQVVGPIRAGNGFHLLKLIAVRNAPHHQLSAQALKEQARRLLFQRKFQEKADNWLQTLRNGTYVKIYSTT